MAALGRALIAVGAVLVVVGLLITFSARLPFRIGRLPGDILIRGKHGVFYFPLMTCLLASVLLSIVVWLLGRK
jgi:hypothetical protein